MFDRITGQDISVRIIKDGALLNELTLTKDGLEVTFATHLLFGTYLLGSLALDVLRSTADSRMAFKCAPRATNVTAMRGANRQAMPALRRP